MTTRLQQTPMPQPQRPAPRWVRPSAFDVSDTSLEQRVWKRRVIAALVLAMPAFLCITAYRIWAIPNVTIMDRQGHTWKARSTVRGQVRLYDTQGKLLGFFSSPSPITRLFPTNDVRISRDGQLLKTIYVDGTHELHTEAGDAMVGYAQIRSDKAENSEISGAYAVAPSSLYNGDYFAFYDIVGTGISWAQIGLAGSVDRRAGLAWKVRGYAAVTVQSYGGNRHIDKLSSVHLPPPSEANRQIIRKTFQDNAPDPAEQPVLSYSIANQNLKYFRMPADGFLFYKGRWVNPVRSGTFTGYGRHSVLDKQGKPLLTFDVQPLGPVATPAARR